MEPWPCRTSNSIPTSRLLPVAGWHPLGVRGHLPGQRGDRGHLIVDDGVNVRPGLQAVPVDHGLDGELVRLVERAGGTGPATDVVGLLALHRLAQLGAGRGAAGHVEVEHRYPLRHAVLEDLPGQQPGEVPGGGPVDGTEGPPLADLRGDRRGDTRDAEGVGLERGTDRPAHADGAADVLTVVDPAYA